ncbi:terminase [Gemmobacter lanyuensis]|uniref:Terminase n=1 Tax=Gemmobacter lanyuensis TaxID=1054497 RepID=A0A918IQY5_9RHOB|nr:terminase TerL endonuclease subunit [Gemmobacter lanyuensis]GGW24033.1 terminase [Gemmobacter lanyuensis]
MAFDFACPDWVEKLERGQTPIADLPLDAEAADRAVQVFNRLRLPDVIGQPSLAEGAGEWIRDVVRAVFGSMSTSSLVPEVRQVGEVFILVPKKNAKTTSAAAIALTFMLLNKRRNADLLVIGPTQKISDVAFGQARDMIDADPEGFLQKRFHVQDHKKQIKCRVTGAKLMVRTFGMDVLTGAKPVFALIDEIHLLGTVPYAADVIRQIRGGMMPFPEALLVMITTQSDHPPAGVFKTELQYARGVRDGLITERVRMLPVLYEFPEAMQTAEHKPWQDPAYWHMVTPNLGRSITLEKLLDGFTRAKQDGIGELIAWATQHLNVEIGLALHSNRWVGADFWLAARDVSLTGLDQLIERSEVAVVGIDGGGADDLLGLNVTGRCRETRQWLSWSHAWCHPVALQRRQENIATMHDFEARGQLTICSHPSEDHAGVCDIVAKLQDAGLLPEAAAIGLDPAGVAALVDELSAVGIAPEQMVAVGQGYRLSSAIWGMERKLMDGTYRHCGQEIMAWCIGNARSEQRGNAVLITKEAAGKGKIDPLIAAFNAFTLMSRNPTAAGSGRFEYTGM